MGPERINSDYKPRRICLKPDANNVVTRLSGESKAKLIPRISPKARPFSPGSRISAFGGHRLLVYEFMPKGSLVNHLFKNKIVVYFNQILKNGTTYRYVRNYAWGDAASFRTLGGLMLYLNELLGALYELIRIELDAERVAWIGRNYKKALGVSKSIFARLLTVFCQSGPLRKAVEVLQQEVLEGGLLKYCLELGSNDLKGLIQVVKDIAFQYSSCSSKTDL
ncbi:protein kinase superfamily protein [Striga asiatica]|uniref:Protein kinase superfamily protein n=1 Tax=Striga asiatica TaxID=4170 RepID=A0A5A7Q7A1_STRAF|nr:protein kinase superfamily protein [Striga asiatica]